MAQTLKFGSGTWATKKGSTLAYNDLGGNFKPLPFTTTRSTSATRVNKEGLIEVVENDRPRIDYTDSEDGVFLLEKASTNRVTYSEDFSQWIDYNASAVLSEETIYGKNAYKIVEDNTTNYHGIYLPNLFTADGTNYISSVYVKGDERRYVVLTGRAGISSNDSAVIFDTQNGEWVLDISAQNQAFSSESVGNGWWRISIEGNPTSGAYDNFTIAASTGYSNYLDANYQGDGTSGFYVAFAQLEQGSYATSYIPTSGQANGVTRVIEVCNNGANEQVINSTEGVLYVEIKRPINQLETSQYLGVSDGSTDNRFIIGASASSSNLRFIGDMNDVRVLDVTRAGFNKTDWLKIAIVWDLSEFKIFINGTKNYETTFSDNFTSNTLNTFEFSNGSKSSVFYGILKDARIYNTALTDQELIALTQ